MDFNYGRKVAQEFITKEPFFFTPTPVGSEIAVRRPKSDGNVYFNILSAEIDDVWLNVTTPFIATTTLAEHKIAFSLYVPRFLIQQNWNTGELKMDINGEQNALDDWKIYNYYESIENKTDPLEKIKFWNFALGLSDSASRSEKIREEILFLKNKHNIPLSFKEFAWRV